MNIITEHRRIDIDAMAVVEDADVVTVGVGAEVVAEVIEIEEREHL